MLENFGIKDIIDILLVAIIMYQLYRLVNRSGTSAIFKGILAFVVIWVLVSQVFQMRLLGAILDKFVSIGLFVLVILFQDEIRRFLMTLGSNKTFGFLSILFRTNDATDLSNSTIDKIVLACSNLARSYTGALIVIEQEIKLGTFANTGEQIDARISTQLIENIFFKNTPLHDGAMILSSEKILAAGCILPLSQDMNLPSHFGLRHRAALGISKETDAKVIVVSEETGNISFASEGKIQANITAERLQELLIGSLKKKKKE